MSANIIAAIRHCGQLKGNSFLLATEIAHRMNAQGYGRVSYPMMALKAHCSERTAKRRMRKDLEGTIFQVTRYRTKQGNGINLYKCLLPVQAFYRASPATTHGDRVSPTLPDPEREKDSSLRTDIAALKKGMLYWTEGSDQWEASMEKVRKLEAFLQHTPGAHHE